MPQVNNSDLLLLGPVIVLTVFALLVILMESFTLGKRRDFIMRLAVLGGISAFATSIYFYLQLEGLDRQFLFNGMLVADKTSMIFATLFSAVAIMVSLTAAGHQRTYNWENGKFYGLLLLACAGMTILAMAADLVIVFIGVETMSIATYVLVALQRRSRRSSEAAMKYFLMGAFASGFLLYGMALCFGATGTTSLQGIRQALTTTNSEALLIVGVFMLIIGFGFKVAAFPFHMWAPDVYEGAPTPVTGFMAAAVKAGAFAGIVRVFIDGFGGEVFPLGKMGWVGIFAGLAAVTMTVGNIAALKQRNVKRMLAYSSVSHAGFLLISVVSMGLSGASTASVSLLYYLVVYSMTTLGVFGVMAWVSGKERERVLVNDWAGVAQKHPVMALAMTIFLLSLAGMPPTGGFVGKFLVLKDAMEAQGGQLIWLVVVGVVNSMISIFYYLRVIMAMYFRDPVGDLEECRSFGQTTVVFFSVVVVLLMGILPGLWIGLLS